MIVGGKQAVGGHFNPPGFCVLQMLPPKGILAAFVEHNSQEGIPHQCTNGGEQSNATKWIPSLLACSSFALGTFAPTQLNESGPMGHSQSDILILLSLEGTERKDKEEDVYGGLELIKGFRIRNSVVHKIVKLANIC